jgi:DNA-binding XRE family transcriptional regulator
MSVVDWENKPEPWRSIGLSFVADLRRIVKTAPGQIVAQERLKTLDPDPALTRGQQMRALREQRKWSQSKLARYAGLNIQTIIRLENGTRANPTTLEKLSRVFDLDLVAFYGEAR